MKPNLKRWLLLFTLSTALIFIQSASPGRAAGATVRVPADFSTIQSALIDPGTADFVRNTEAVLDLTPADNLWVAPDIGMESSLASSTPPGFKVAFIGDQGSGSDATAVLQLIKDEGTDLVLHQGDFDYSDDPKAWDQKITDVLGKSFPYFISIGNHDNDAWSGSDGYQAKFAQRLARITDAECTGDLGVNSICIYKGLAIVLSGVGTKGSGHEAYIQESLAADDHIWRICSWHRTMKKMQVGGKSDDTGWGVYEACLAAGAIVATAHEHSYSRTHLMSSFEDQVVADTSSTLVLDEGRSFAFVNGLGGKSVRNQDRCLPAEYPYGCDGEWASIYTSDQGANHGALFCAFNVNGKPDHADCYFKDIDGAVPDQFELVSNLDAPNDPPKGTPGHFYFSLGGDGSVDGLSVDNEDIVGFDGSEFSLFFDGSDVGIGGFRLNAFAVTSASEILMSFDQSGSVPGISGTVDDSDIVRFTATKLGKTTAGAFELYFDGSDVGLTSSDEDVDALNLLANGNLLISTRDSVSVPDVSGKDEDILEFTPGSLGGNTTGSWSLYFDGSDVGLTSSGEDLDGLGLDAEGKLYLSSTGSLSANGASGADEDVFIFTPSKLGPGTSGSFDSTLYFDGSKYGLGGNDIWAIDIPTGPDPLELVATAYKVKGTQRVDLAWSGATSSAVNVYRDGNMIATTSQNPYTDILGKTRGSYNYHICDQGGNSRCSNTVTVTF